MHPVRFYQLILLANLWSDQNALGGEHIRHWKGEFYSWSADCCKKLNIAINSLLLFHGNRNSLFWFQSNLIEIFMYCCYFLYLVKRRPPKSCSSHRFIFSSESMPPPSNSASNWPISGQSALIPSSSKELFFLTLFESLPEQRVLGKQRRKTSLWSHATRSSSIDDLRWR